MKQNKYKIINGQLLTPSGIMKDGIVCVDGNRIVEIGQMNIDFPDSIIINAHGNYISPGFIDLHTHGAGGADFMDETPEAFLTIAEMHAKHGTTGLYPTTLSSTREHILNTITTYEKAKAINDKGSAFMGLHLEGPYFSMNQCGAQDPRFIRNPQPEEYLPIIDAGPCIKRWSSAPELDGDEAFVKILLKKDILPAIAHSDAIYEEVLAAWKRGYRHITHLYSGMSGVTRRKGFRFAGVIESAFLIDEMTVEIIADGCHLPASLLQLIYKFKGPDKIALITDSMRGAGMPEGKSILGGLAAGQEVIVEDGVAKMPDRLAFAGSVATTDRLVRTMCSIAEIPLTEAVKMATETPAHIMHINDKKGSLQKNKDADIIIFDNQIHVMMTMVNGKIVYKES